MNLREEGCWEQHYEEELRNFEDNGDCGDVWFGKPLTRRIIDWIVADIKNDYVEDSSTSISILDVGCGNAYLLSALIKKSTESLDGPMLNRLQLHGIDYSKNSIQLSRKIIESENKSSQIHLKQCDFLDIQQVAQLNQGSKFDYIVDKGTFDAIRLIGDGHNDGRQVEQKYTQSLLTLIKPKTKLIIASCNHTEDELINLFSMDCDGERRAIYRLVDRIETPMIRFGGKEGSQVCCLILRFD